MLVEAFPWVKLSEFREWKPLNPSQKAQKKIQHLISE